MQTVLENQKFAVVKAAQSAAQTAIESDVVDMKGFDDITFVALLGDVSDTCVLTLTLQQGESDDGSDMEDTGISATYTAGASDADDKALAVEGHYPTKRYARAKLTRTTANAAVSGILALQSAPRGHVPIDQDASVISSATGSPIKAA